MIEDLSLTDYITTSLCPNLLSISHAGIFQYHLSFRLHLRARLRDFLQATGHQLHLPPDLEARVFRLDIRTITPLIEAAINAESDETNPLPVERLWHVYLHEPQPILEKKHVA